MASHNDKLRGEQEATAAAAAASSASAASPTWNYSTLCATIYDPEHMDQYGSSSMPIYQSTTFKGLPGSEANASEEFDYSRSGNPTRTVLQNHLAKIQGCKHTFCVATGMAALDVILRQVKSGEYVLAGDDIYGGTNRILTYLKETGQVQPVHIDMTKPEVVDKTVRELVEAHKAGRGAKLGMVLVESPTNPMLKVIDIKSCVQIVRKYTTPEETPIVMDNTMMSPVFMRPLELGVDVCYDSGTKYLSGHHDMMAGVIATNRDDIAKLYAHIINSVGNALAPFESFLLLRGLKTLVLRIRQQQSSAQIIAEHLQEMGFRTHYPGLPNHPGRDIHYAQAKGAGAVMSMETGDAELSRRILGGVKLWGISVSFGSVNSLISMPCLMSHSSIDPNVRKERALPEDLIRLCVGIEDVEDLIADLDRALLAAGAVENVNGKLVRAFKPPAGAVSAPSNGDAHDTPNSLVVSSPGKVILFGEHAVVHGVTALAASISLRCYALVQPRFDGKLHLELPELQVDHDWVIDELPWDAVPSGRGSLEANPAKTVGEVDARLLRCIVQAVEKKAGTADRSHASCVAFLYLYMTLSKSRAAQTFTIRALLPIGAGLGSSASYSACLSAALLYTNKLLPPPPPAAALPSEHAVLINEYAFLSERVLHGNPSGVDNSVAVFGGCLTFRRPSTARNSLQANELKLLAGMKAKRLLLTDTGVSRNTKQLVAGVQAKLDAEPAKVNAVFDEIQAITDEASQLLSGNKTDDAKLAALITRNHELLEGLGVSHPSLEAIRTTLSAADSGRGFATKLTGAGGGGCAVSLIPTECPTSIVSDAMQSLKSLMQVSLVEETAVGGPGVSVLSDFGLLRETSTGRDSETGAVKEALEVERFKMASKEELEGWLEGQCKAGWVRAQ